MNRGLDARKPEIEADYKKAIENDPTDGDAMQSLSDLIADEERPDEALSLLEKALKTPLSYDALPYVHWRIAKIYKTKGDFTKALNSIETAISIKASDAGFYDLHAELARACKQPEEEVTQHLAEGYIKVADARLRGGMKAQAIDFYWRAVEELAKTRSAKNKLEMARRLAEPIAKISAVVERTAISAGRDRSASKAKAVEFWKAAIESKQRPDMRDLFESELKRLAAPQ